TSAGMAATPTGSCWRGTRPAPPWWRCWRPNPPTRAAPRCGWGRAGGGGGGGGWGGGGVSRGRKWGGVGAWGTLGGAGWGGGGPGGVGRRVKIGLRKPGERVNPFGLVFGSDEGVRKQASPIEHVRRGLPPFLLLTAEDEVPSLPNMAEDFEAALRRTGNEV